MSTLHQVSSWDISEDMGGVTRAIGAGGGCPQRVAALVEASPCVNCETIRCTSLIPARTSLITPKTVGLTPGCSAPLSASVEGSTCVVNRIRAGG